jgi:AmmeMemoRadiSam system protein A
MNNDFDKQYTALARQAISHWLKTNIILDIAELELPATLTEHRAGVFVTLHKNGDLRGCIGTFKPTKKNIAEEIAANAISAAFCDTRFQPLEKKELDQVKIEVSVLKPRQEIKSKEELDPKKYGLIIETPEKKCGLLLPDIEGIETVDQQIELASQKCGVEYSKEKHKLYRFTVEKHAE